IVTLLEAARLGHIVNGLTGYISKWREGALSVTFNITRYGVFTLAATCDTTFARATWQVKQAEWGEIATPEEETVVTEASSESRGRETSRVVGVRRLNRFRTL